MCRMSTTDKDMGVIFDLDGDTFDVAKARESARYLCQLCNKEWGDDHRRLAILEGLTYGKFKGWIPRGMELTQRRKLRGTIDGDVENASFQLSRLYAPTFTFADIAQEIAKAQLDPDRQQNLDNSWFAQTYRQRMAIHDWETVGKRLKQDYPIRRVPGSGVFLTVGVDVQLDCYVFVTVAWGNLGMGWVVDYGHCYTDGELASILRSQYEHADGGPPDPCDPGALLRRQRSGTGRRRPA